MARSHLKTTLSVLRNILGQSGQLDNFARLTGLSVSLIEKASAGIRPVTDDASIAIAHVTGIDAVWLTSGKPSKPLDQKGNPFVKETFIRRKKELADGGGSSIDRVARHLIAGEVARLAAVVNADPVGAAIVAYRLQKFMAELVEDLEMPMDYRNQKSEWLLSRLGAVASGDFGIGFITPDSGLPPVTRRRGTE